MSCNKHFLNLRWEHHDWQPQVTFAEMITSHETNQWGRMADVHYVRCERHDVCDTCGKMLDTVSCVCDPAVGERCQIRLDWMAASAVRR